MFALVWVVSPIDLIPEFIPVIGTPDDIVVRLTLVWYFVCSGTPNPSARNVTGEHRAGKVA